MNVDLTECETENLTHTGFVQPFGHLALFKDDGVLLASTSGGKKLAPFMTSELLSVVTDKPTRIFVKTSNTSEIFVHRTSDGIIIEEIYPTEIPGHDFTSVLDNAAARLQSTGDHNIYRNAQALADAVRIATAYDRVMVYRFHPDWSGEVIAEARDAKFTPYLGLRYPASDIPPQSRALYLRNVLRVVGDVDDVEQPVTVHGCQPDLSMAVLRSVSRYHIAYLRNMGVRATLTASIIRDGALWGMLVCHHGTRRFPPAEIRAACLHLTDIFTSRLAQFEEAQKKDADIVVRRVLSLSGKDNQHTAKILERLLLSQDGWMTWLDADGFVIGHGEYFVGSGILPPVSTLRELVTQHLDAAIQEASIPISSSDSPWMPPPVGVCIARSGTGHWAAAFRAEMIHDIVWGGNPDKPADLDAGGNLSPRRSFAAWRQTMRGRAKPWQDKDRSILAAVVRLLDQTNPFSETWGGTSDRQDFGANLPALLVPHLPALVTESREGKEFVIYVTPSWLRLLGMTSDMVVGRELAELCASLGFGLHNGTDAVQARHVTVFSPEKGQVILAPQMRSALVALDDTPRCLNVLIFSDTTRTESLASALRASLDDSETARSSRMSILRSLSHEFRTPLNAILGFSDLIAMDTRDTNPTLHGYAEEVIRASKDLLRILETVLDVARLQTSRIPLQLTKVRLSEEFETVKARLHAFAKERDTAVDVSVTPPDCVCVTDGTLLRQILTNLVENAIKFSPRNSRVLLSATLETTRIAIAVIDEGPGVPEDLRERIFEPLVQGGDGTTGKKEGIGLGLYLARGMAESLNAVLRYEPLGKRSRFLLLLPIRNDATA